MFIFNNFSTCFGHHYAHLQENKTYVTAHGVLRWYCWMWLVAVVGRCVVGCEHCEGCCTALYCTVLYCTVLYCTRTVTFTVLASYNAAPHNHYQPHPAVPAQHTMCSNIRLVLLKMGIMMPETCWEIVENKHLTVASCWFSLSLHSFRSSEYGTHGYHVARKYYELSRRDGSKQVSPICIFILNIHIKPRRNRRLLKIHLTKRVAAQCTQCHM